MQTLQLLPVPNIGRMAFVDPFKSVNDALAGWSRFWDTFAKDIAGIMGNHPRTARTSAPKAVALSPRDVTQDRINRLQWELYVRHLVRWGWELNVPEGRQCWRFKLWSDRWSYSFRQLIQLYQIEWLEQYGALTKTRTRTCDHITRPCRTNRKLEALFRNIERHLYQ